MNNEAAESITQAEGKKEQKQKFFCDTENERCVPSFHLFVLFDLNQRILNQKPFKANFVFS